jgi:hypothetical protein
LNLEDPAESEKRIDETSLNADAENSLMENGSIVGVMVTDGEKTMNE